MSYDDSKKEVLEKVHANYGIFNLFHELGLEPTTSNGNVYCCCPFHEGADNPTGFAYANGFGYCFTQCNRKYNLFDLVMKVKSYDFMQSLNYLADLVGVDVYSTKRVDFGTEGLVNKSFLSSRRRTKKLRSEIQYQSIDMSIFDNIEPKLHKILRIEGFDNEIRDYFNLGFCLEGYLENRITIPVDARDGTIVTISGRSPLDSEACEELGIKKYLIMKDTDKAVTLYNISRALPHIIEKGQVFVFEGFKSVWRMHQWGYKNCVCTMGTSFSDEQRKLLLSLGVKVVICGDNDKAGKKYNKQVSELIGMYSDKVIFDLGKIDNIPNKASIDNITREQFESLYTSYKGVL